MVAYGEVGEMDEGPGHARGAAEEGEDEEPGEEDDKDVGSPHARVGEPLGVPVQIRRRRCLHVHYSLFSAYEPPWDDDR